MSIDKSGTVDAIGKEIASGKIVLTISDHLDWSEERAHLLALQDKVNTYLRFIEAGELIATYPDAEGRSLVIEIVARLPIPETGKRFLDQIRPVLIAAGVELRTRVLDDGIET